MTKFLKKKYIWIPCLLLIAAALILFFVLKGSSGTQDEPASTEASASVEATEPGASDTSQTDPAQAGTEGLPQQQDSELLTGEADTAEAIDGGGDWDDAAATDSADDQPGEDEDPADTDDDPAGEGESEVSEEDILSDDREWGPIS